MSICPGLLRMLAIRTWPNYYTENPTMARRRISTSKQQNFKVCIIGGSGGIGQPLSLLLKLNPMVTSIAINDMAIFTKGVAKDLSHIDTACDVEDGYIGQQDMTRALEGSDIVVVPAGLPRKPGMSRADLFNANAIVVHDVAQGVAQVCPKALLAIITNPVNTVVPIACEVLRKANVFDPNKVFGVTTLDLVRARNFVGQILKIPPCKVSANVICGHSATTIIPLLSSIEPPLNIEHERIVKLTKRIQNAGTEVVAAKVGAGSATLSSAHSGAIFVNSLLRGLCGEEDVVECAYVRSDVSEAEYCSSPLLLGKEGIAKNYGIPEMNDFEKEMFQTAIAELKIDIKRGVEFVKNP